MVAGVRRRYKTDVHQNVLWHLNKDVFFPIYPEQKVTKCQIIRAFRSWHMGSLEKSGLYFTSHLTFFLTLHENMTMPSHWHTKPGWVCE